MLKLLIVDDEKVIRESLAECLDWEKYGIQVVGLCANGLEALDTILDSSSPDIVMTDVKMPGLTGLELIEKMQDIDRNIEFIILSGYREFDFAQKAIELGVRRYLLKPVSEEQVLESVLDAVNSCEKRRSVNVTMEEHKKLQMQVGQYYRRQLQYALLRQDRSLEQAVEAYLERFPGQENSYLVCVVSSLTLEDAQHLAPVLSPRLTAAGLSAVTDFLFAKNTLSVILHGEMSGIAKMIENTVAAVSHAFNVKCEKKPLKDGAEYLRRNFALSTYVYTLDEEGRAFELYNADLSLKVVQQLPEQLIALAGEGKRDDVEDLIRNYLSSLEELHTLRAMGAYLISGVLVHGQHPNAAEDGYEGIFDDIYRENERDVLIDNLVEAILTLLWEEKSGNYLIQTVKSYVRRNLSDSTLSLKMIASQYAHVNVDYLSRLFVRATGEKFSHYLNRKRVEKAKHLLQADSSKVYQVAEQVGLGHNPRYFGQVFKKYTGMTPSSYAERLSEPESNRRD